MNVTKENVDNVNATITVRLEKPDYEEAVNSSLKEYRQKADIPGFRPGKVPMGLIQKRFGKSILAEEVNKLLSDSLTKYIVEEKLPLLGEPLPNEKDQKPIDFDNDEDFEFVFDVAIAPEIEVALDKKNKFDYFTIAVDDKMIDQQIETVENQFGQNVDAEIVEEKSLVRGDFVQLDADGNEIEEGIRPEAVLISVEKIKVEEVKSAAIGSKKEDTLIFDPLKAYENTQEVGHMLSIKPEEVEELNSEFKFTIKEILNFEKAEVNEELFKKVYGEQTEVTTIEQFRDKVKEEIAKNLSYSSDQRFAVDTRDKMVDTMEMEVPEAFLKRWLLAVNKELTAEQIENDFENFIKDLKWQLIKETIGKDNEIKVEDEEAKDFARQITHAQFSQYGMYNMTDEQLDSFADAMLAKPEEKERIYKKLFEDKVLEVVKEATTLKTKEVSMDEFSGKEE